MSGETGLSVAGRSHGTKYLTFGLGNEEYAIDIMVVREIITPVTVRSVPKVPGYIKGIINLRDHVIPIIDLRAKFGMAAIPPTEETCDIVLDIDGRPVGVVVDRVLEVVDIGADRIEPAPDVGGGVDTSSIRGIGKVGERVIVLLDIAAALERAPEADEEGDLYINREVAPRAA
jgi:purine-binding chemotaxis protein CheW